MKKRSLLHFIFGFGIGTVVGFVLRNMESTEYNTGYQPKTQVFKEEDYFTNDVIKQHQAEKLARKQAKEQQCEMHDLKVVKDLEEEPASEQTAIESEEVPEGTVEEIVDDGVSEGLDALREVVESHEDC